jgi:hypothetical protein
LKPIGVRLGCGIDEEVNCRRKFTQEVKPARMADFMAKLKKAAASRFESKVMPKSFRLFRSTVPGPDTGPLIMMIEYEEMAAYGARTAFENFNPEWQQLFEAQQDSPKPCEQSNCRPRFQIKGAVTFNDEICMWFRNKTVTRCQQITSKCW